MNNPDFASFKIVNISNKVRVNNVNVTRYNLLNYFFKVYFLKQISDPKNGNVVLNFQIDVSNFINFYNVKIVEDPNFRVSLNVNSVIFVFYNLDFSV